MEIRKSAWHYKFFTMGFDSGYGGEAANLCSYFWRTVAGILKVVCIVAVLVCLAAGIVSCIIQFPLYCFALVLAITVVVNAPRVVRRGTSKRAQPKEPGLLRSYLRAKKNKHCPLVTFVE